MKSILKDWKNFINVLPYNRPDDKTAIEIKPDDLIYIDQTPAQEFNRNEAGWIRNDISAFEMAESENLALDILSRFEEIKQDDLYKGMTEKEMFEAVITRRATSDPVLYTKALEVYTKVQYESMKRNAEKEWSEKQINEANEAKDIKDVSSAVETSSPAT